MHKYVKGNFSFCVSCGIIVSRSCGIVAMLFVSVISKNDTIQYAPIAQGIEWHTPNVKVAGSNPVRRTKKIGFCLFFFALEFAFKN